jgi:Mg-chelatase subunit ChlD
MSGKTEPPFWKVTPRVALIFARLPQVVGSVGSLAMMRKRLLVGSVALLAAGVAAACSGGAEPSSSGGTGGTSATGGSAGSSANGGSAGSSATGGSAGSSATGGSAGSSAAGGTGGTGGSSGGAGGAVNQAGESGTSGEGGMQACAKDVQEAKLTPANLLFVIDKSGSMECNPPNGDVDLGNMCERFPRKEDPTQPSKWEVTRAALATALDTLALQENVSAGLSVFPKGPASNSCTVDDTPEVPIAKLDAAQRSAIGTLLDGIEPAGLTPIAGATILSYAHLADQLRARQLVGNTFVVLLTDGAETCRKEELPPLVEEDVPNARLFNIRTFVIGAPGSEPARGLLSRIAYEGGTSASAGCDHSGALIDDDTGDCHFDMTTSTDFAADLNDALLAISRTKTLSCTFDVPTNPNGGGVNLNEVNVTFEAGDGSVEQPPNVPGQDCENDVDGWQYSADKTKIVLCGEICDRVQADPEGQVSIVLGCPTVKDVT